MVGVALPEAAEGIQTGAAATDPNAAVREAAREQFQRAEQADCAWEAEMEMRQHYQQSTAHLKADNALLHENLHNVVEQGDQKMQQVLLEGNIRIGQERAAADARVADVFVQGRNEYMNLQNQQQQDASAYREHMEQKQAELNAAYLESNTAKSMAAETLHKTREFMDQKEQSVLELSSSGGTQSWTGAEPQLKLDASKPYNKFKSKGGRLKGLGSRITCSSDVIRFWKRKQC